MPPDDHLDGRDVDAEFAAIIAGWDDVPDLPKFLTDEPSAPADLAGPGGSADPGSGPDPAGPVPTDRTTDPGDAGAAAGPPVVPPSPPVPSPPVASSPPARETPPPGIVEAGLEEGHYEPPAVHLPPQDDLHFWGIVLGLTVGPLLLLFMVFFGEGHSRWWTYAAFALILGGFALLVLRQPRRRDEDDHDDGARL